MYMQEGKITIRSFEDKDVEQTLQVMDDFKIKHYIPGAYCSNLEDAKNLVRLYQEEFNGRCGYAMAVLVDEKMVGAINLAFDEGKYDVAYIISAKERGKGYASKALKLALKWAKMHTSVKEAMFKIEQGNFASEGVAKSIGAKYSHEEFGEDIYVIRL